MKKILIIFFALHLSTLANAADIKTKYISSLSDYLENSLKGNFETVEAELSSGTSNEVVGSILVVTPLSEIENKNPVFFQGSVFFSDDSRETINLGIGKRQLLNNDNLILKLQTIMLKIILVLFFFPTRHPTLHIMKL